SEAEAAVAAAKAQVDQAYAIGLRFRRTVATPYAPPRTIHFAFGRHDLDATGAAACQDAADFLRARPDATLDLVGHTDQVGTDSANDALGSRRAETVKGALVAAGVDAARITTASRGESEPVSEDPRQYRLNRRVEFGWGSRPISEPSREREEALAALALEIPDFRPVLDRVPRAFDALNVELEDWHWGSMPQNIRDGFNTWMSVHIRPVLLPMLADKALKPIVITTPPLTGVTLEPRPVAKRQVEKLFENPVAYLNDAFGTPAGP
ncbi:MAG: OmpA family protein, partial [Streptomyces sp.]|nr:OmpA family protein [Streptomyces sp.]